MAMLFERVGNSSSGVEGVEFVWRRIRRNIGMKNQNPHANQAATTRGRGFTFSSGWRLKKALMILPISWA